MKIGIIGPIWISIPPRRYGGTEDVVHTLTEGLVEKGHEVVLFAPKTTQTSVRLIPTVEKTLEEAGIGWSDSGAINMHLYHLETAFRHANEFDVLHVHLNKVHDNPALLLALQSATPVIFTFHYPAPTPTYRPEKYIFLSDFPYMPYTSISDAARSGNSWNFIRTVYNAIDIKQFSYSETADDYFAWLGKALPIKGLKEAIIVAKKAGVKLKIMAAIDNHNPISVNYFEKEVKPLIDGKQIEYLGEADLKMKAQIFGRAKAFINPIQWPEPFGLVMAEAQAVGTPVLVLNKGGAKELVADGKTGFVVETVDEMVEKVKLVDQLKRSDCRDHAVARFSPEIMVEGYEAAYRQGIEHWNEYVQKQRDYLATH